jgi:hypothetical protein
VTFVVLFNLNTHEEFRYEVPTREAQALVDMAMVAWLDWAIKDASSDVLVPIRIRLGESK